MFFGGFHTTEELREAGFKSVGEHVSIAKSCVIVGFENISIGDNVRIDDFCTVVATGDGFLDLGSYVHIGGYCLLSAGDGIAMRDFSGLSQGVRIYSRTDDYSGEHLTNPTVPEQYTGYLGGTVVLGRHVIIGSGTVILPGVTIGSGSAVGALALVNCSLDEWGIYAGAPAKRVKDRSMGLLVQEQELHAQLVRESNKR